MSKVIVPTADDLVLQEITTRTEFDDLREAWNDACLAASPANVFLTWEWVSTWWNHFGSERRLRVLVFSDAAGIAAIAPLQLSQIGLGPFRSRVLERISPEAGDYGGIVVARRHDDVANLLADHVTGLLRRRRISIFSLSRISSDDPFLTSWRRALTERTSTLASAEHRLDGDCLLTNIREDFVLSKHTKKHKIRQRQRRLAEAYENTEVHHHTGPSLECGIRRLLDVHGSRWEERGDELRGLLAEPDREAFLLDAIRALDGEQRVQLLTMTADGQTVAAELDFEFGDRIFMFKGAFDPAFAPFSPGQLLHHRVFHDALERDIRVVDFGRGDQPYKRRWANDERHLVTSTVTTSGLVGTIDKARLRINRRLALKWSGRARRGAMVT